MSMTVRHPESLLALSVRVPFFNPSALRSKALGNTAATGEVLLIAVSRPIVRHFGTVAPETPFRYPDVEILEVV
jgi:hypothetical protein